MPKRLVACLIVSLSIIVAGGRPAFGGPKDDKSKSNEKKKSKKRSDKDSDSKMPALAFTMKDIDGKDQDLRQYAGKVVLMVNVASQCGFTPQYKGLQELYEKYKDQGLVILGFPANDFGRQEPGTNEEIKSFCTGKYGVTFPMFAKVHVKGKDMCPLYEFLTRPSSKNRHGGDVTWNFNKFLISRQGEVADRFDTRVKPSDEKLVKAVEKALAEPADGKSAKKSGKKAGE